MWVDELNENAVVSSESELRAKRPNASLPSVLTPEILSELGFKPLHIEAQPSFDADTHRLEKAGPALNNDRWEQTWNVIELTEQEKQVRQQARASTAGRAARSRRDALLKETDWTQLDDTPISNAKKLGWATYRQALRDVPSQPGFPLEVTWPEQP